MYQLQLRNIGVWLKMLFINWLFILPLKNDNCCNYISFWSRHFISLVLLTKAALITLFTFLNKSSPQSWQIYQPCLFFANDDTFFSLNTYITEEFSVMVTDVKVYSHQSYPTCLRWQHITANICFSCQLLSVFTPILHEFTPSRAFLEHTVRPALRIFFFPSTEWKKGPNIIYIYFFFDPVRGREEQESARLVCLFLSVVS